MNSQAEGRSDIILYHSPLLYATRKVVMYLQERKIPYKSFCVDFIGYEHYEPWFINLNGKRELPVIKHRGNVVNVRDPEQMMDYLEKEFDTPPKLALADQNKTEQKKYQQMREKMQNLRMDIIFFGCMKYPELTSGMQFSPREMKWFMELQGNKSQALQKCEKKYPSLRQHYITSLDKIKHLDKEWEDKVRVMERLEDVEAILDQVERQLVTQNGTGDTYLFGKQFTIGDIDLIILLQQLDVLSLSERFWEGGTRPKLAAYYNRVKNRPSLKVAVEVNLMKHILYPKIRRNAGFLIGSVVLLTAVAVGAWWYTRS